MKFINKATAIIFLFIIIYFSTLFPNAYQSLVLSLALSLFTFILAILIYKYKCVNLIAGVENRSNIDANKQSKYGGLLLFIISLMLLIAALIFFINPSFSKSPYMIILAIPIIIAIPFYIYKMNK